MPARFTTDDGGFYSDPDGEMVLYADYQSLESKLDLMTIQADHWHEQNVELESRLDTVRAKCEAAVTVPVGTDYPYGEGYRVACEHILTMIVERRKPETAEQYLKQQIQAADDMTKLSADDLNKRIPT